MNGRVARRVLALAFVLAACSDPEPRDGVYACGADDLCPEGMSCGPDGRCHRATSGDAGPSRDSGGGLDASPDDAGVGPDTGSGGDLVVQLAGGDYHTCARRERGSVSCWGSNTMGQLGIPLETAASAPARVEHLPPAIDLAAGRYSTCIATDAGEAWCWGVNAIGQSVPASAEDPVAPTRVAGVTGALLVATGERHACAVVEPDRSVRCWGANQRGQLGPDVALGGEAVAPTTVPGLTGIVEIRAGQTFTCARTRAGAVLCWGDNSHGELGDGTADELVAAPRAVVGVEEAEAIAAGSAHACALRNGRLLCWGNNDSAQLAREPLAGLDISREAVLLGEDISGVLGLAAGGGDSGSGHTCVRRQLDVLCWGSNTQLQLGGRGGAAQPIPQSVGLTVTALGCGASHSCAVGPDGAVRCWGGNDIGQLGFESGGDPVSTPTIVEGIP